MKFLKLVAFFLLLVSTISCSEDYKILESVTEIITTADNSFTLINNNVTFSSFTSKGENITTKAKFFVDGQLVAGNTFSSSTIGQFSITSEYLGATSNPIIITFHDGSQVNFRKRVLIEDYTGTWCGYCTRVAYAIDKLKTITDDAVVVAIHRSSSVPASPNYDPYNYDTSELESLLPISGYPKGLINRLTQWTKPQENNLAQVISLTQGSNPKLGLAMNTNVTGNNISIEVKVKFSKNFSNIKLVVYVLENNLVYSQKNYTNYYGAINPLPNFVHNHTLRSCITNLLGDAISNNDVLNGNTYNRTFNFAMPSNVANAANIEFVAFVIDENGNAINVRKASKNENQSFEEL